MFFVIIVPMVFSNVYLFTLPIIFFYMFVYNLTFLGLFWVFVVFYNTTFKTLYSFNTFSFDSPFLLSLTIFLFSLAGVPPFIGFFSKVYLLNILVTNGFFTLYSLFVILLMLGLYFYVQNIRYLHTTNQQSNLKPYLVNTRKSVALSYYLILWTFILLNGILFVEDFLLYFFWLLL